MRNRETSSSSAWFALSLAAGMLITACKDDDGNEPSMNMSGGDAGTATEELPPMAQESARQSGTTIALSLGKLEGKQVGATREFLGIPYAKPPVGDLRFAPPQPIAAWSETRQATDFGASCPQASGTLSSMKASNEDCLFLNVYTPEHVEKALPVMVFIHGGAFTSGGSDQYDGQSLSEAGPVVLVTLNYRLGALGFVALPALDDTRSGAPSGADGIRDQQLALKFVHEHIAAFGGDASNVTVFGESAGSASTCVHFVAPGSRTLAQRFIMESGACVSGGIGAGDHDAAVATGQHLADALCGGESDVVACLRKQSADTLVNWGADQGLFGAGWGPSVEGEGGVLPDTADHLLADPSFKPAPVLIGTNLHEWGLFQLLGSPKQMTVEMLNAAIDQSFGDGASKVKEHYHADNDDQANDVYVRIVTDLTFRCSTRSLARTLSDKGSKVYMYSFEQGTAYHAQELDYVFGSDTLTAFGGGPKAAALQTAVQGYWTKFATDSDPNGGDRPSWPVYQSDSDQYLKLIDPPASATGLEKSECEFWAQYTRDGGTIKLAL